MSELPKQSKSSSPDHHPWLRRVFHALPPRLIAISGASAGLVVLAVIPLFVSFSSTQIKDVFDQFTGGCVLVLDKSMAPDGKVFVVGRIAGAMPKQLPLIFEGREALVNTISFESPYRGDQIREPDDLTYHPMAGQDCAGSLCAGLGEFETRRHVPIMLKDVRPEFTYRFLVRLVPLPATTANPALVQGPGTKTGPVEFMASPDKLKVYALYEQGIEGQVCRVEPRRWFNFWVWATPLKKALLFIFVIVLGGLLLRWAKTQGGNAS
jgi:hypothetical protein